MATTAKKANGKAKKAATTSVKDSAYTKGKLTASRRFKEGQTVTYSGKVQRYAGKRGKVVGVDAYGGIKVKIGETVFVCSPYAVGAERPGATAKSAAKPAGNGTGRANGGKNGNGSKK